MADLASRTKNDPKSDKFLSEFVTRQEIREEARRGKQFEETETRLMKGKQKKSVMLGELQKWIDESPRMPVWKNGFSALPNSLVRSSVFRSASNKTNKNRPSLMRKKLSVLGPGEVFYSGFEMRQDDKDVLLALTDRARREHGGKPLTPNGFFEVTVTKYTFLRELGWSQNSRNRDRLEDCLTRLESCQLRLISSADMARDEQEGKTCSFIGQHVFTAKKLTIPMPHRYFEMLSKGFTLVNMNVLKTLPAGFTRWLYTYVLSHKDQKKISVLAIIRHAGLVEPTTSADLARRRQIIRKAGINLVSSGVLAEARIDNTDRFEYRRSADALKAPNLIQQEKGTKAATLSATSQVIHGSYTKNQSNG
jgi:hypothetical protein